MKATPIVPAALALGLVIIAATRLLATMAHQPVGMYTRDVKALCSEAGAELPALVGGMGLINMMVWSAVAALALLVAALWPERRRWLVVFASFVLFLAVDDSMQLHEEVGPAHGIPERGFYLVYAVAAVVLLDGDLRGSLSAVRRNGLRQLSARTIAFLLGGLLLAASVAADQLLHRHHLTEDAPKLLGAMVWLTVPLLCLPAGSVQRMTRSLSGSNETRAQGEELPSPSG